MKVSTTFHIEAKSRTQLVAVLRFLREMGMEVTEHYPEPDTHQLSMVSEPSLAEAWLSEEDDRWDELYSEAK